MQDLHYAYDPVGNPVLVRDAVLNPTFANNQIIPNTRAYQHDPRYRLIRAQGRRLTTMGPKATNPLAPAPSESDYVPYDLRYAYDEVGNFRVNHELQEFQRTRAVRFRHAGELTNGSTQFGTSSTSEDSGDA